MIRPLNGTRTPPLSGHAIDALRRLQHGPVPRQEFNPGVSNRLEREALVDSVEIQTPYATRKGSVLALRITEAGREALAQAEER